MSIDLPHTLFPVNDDQSINVKEDENLDGEFRQTMEKAAKDFQTLRKFEQDGEIGADTWTALLTT